MIQTKNNFLYDFFFLISIVYCLIDGSNIRCFYRHFCNSSKINDCALIVTSDIPFFFEYPSQAESTECEMYANFYDNLCPFVCQQMSIPILICSNNHAFGCAVS